jgi:zinc/manganese transport system substrate-binding protein
MIRRLVSVTLAALVLAGVASATTSGRAEAAVNVVATLPDLGAITREIGGKNVNVTTLALPTQDPHFVDAKPSLALAVSKADLLIVIGLDLEIGWLPTLQLGSRNEKVQTGGKGYLDCSTLVNRLEIPQEKLDRAHGDIHPGGNPHYLYDPRAAAQVASGIAARLAQLDPAHEADYKAGLKAFQDKLSAARARWEKRLAGVRGQQVITYHRSWVYLVDWLGLVDAAELEPKPGIPPTSKHVAEVLVAGRKAGAKLILQESYYPDTTSKLLADKLPAKVVSLPGGADFKGGEGYVEHMDKLVDAIARALGA